MNLFGARKASSTGASQSEAAQQNPDAFSDARLPDANSIGAASAAHDSSVSDLSQPFFRNSVRDFWDDIRLVLNSFNNGGAVMLAQARAARRMNLKIDAEADPIVTLTAPDQAPYFIGEVLHELRQIHPGLYRQIEALVKDKPGDIGVLKEEFVFALRFLGVIDQVSEVDYKKVERRAIFRSGVRSFFEGFTLQAIFTPFDPYKSLADSRKQTGSDLSSDLRRARYSWNIDNFSLIKATISSI